MATVTQPHEFAIRVVAKNSNEYRRCHVGGKEDKQSRHRAIAQASFGDIFKGRRCSWLMVNLESAGGLNLADFRQGERDKERIG